MIQLVAILHFFSLHYRIGTALCSSQRSCDSCISENYLCRWCADEEFGDVRCGTSEELASRQCKKIESEQNDLTTDGNIKNEHFEISPKTVSAKFLKGSTEQFQIEVTRKKDYSFETMFVIDYSMSMENLIKSVKDSIKNLIDTKDKYKITKVGIIRYVDKVVHPIVLSDLSPEYDSTFYIELISPLSEDGNRLKQLIDQRRISGNWDKAEASFDAVSECALCNEKVQWSDDPNVLKIIYLFTDDIVKVQTDGRGNGIILPHDLKCHLDNTGKVPDGGNKFDYVSIGQTGYVLRTRNIQLVIVVTKKYMEYYKTLASSWTGVKFRIVELKMEQIDLGKILIESNEHLNSIISLYNDPNPNAEIEVDVSCPDGSQKKSNYECFEVEIGQKVMFSVTAKFLQAPTPQVINLKISSVENVELKFSEISECSCSKTLISGKCSLHGKMACGECHCEEGYAGTNCQCPKGSHTLKEQCIDPKTRLICSNRGICDDCGHCICKMAKDKLKYGGTFCECSRAMCSPKDGVICGGIENGLCECDRCKCNPLFSGQHCEVQICEDAATQNKCKMKDTDILCSGNGECLCGVCKCNLDSKGEFCETKLTKTCNHFEEIAACIVQKQLLQSGTDCVVENINLDLTQTDSYSCRMYDDEGCKIEFNFFRQPDHDQYTVQVKRLDKNKDCTKPLNPYIISSIVFGILFLIGLIILGLYITITIHFYRVEARRFDKEIKDNQDVDIVNPLYR